MPVSTGHVAIRTRVQDWICVRILTGPVITDHWTEAQPKSNKFISTFDSYPGLRIQYALISQRQRKLKDLTGSWVWLRPFQLLRELPKNEES